MIDDDYVLTLDACSTAYRILADRPLDEALLALGRLEALGPILAPTEYLRGQGNLHGQRVVLRAAADFVAACSALKPLEVSG